MDGPASVAVAPPVTRWGMAWRLVGMALISTASITSVAQGRSGFDGDWLWLDLLIGVAALVLVYWRRRWPLSVALLTAAASALSATAAGPAVLAAVSLATWRIYWQVLLVGLASVVAGQAFVTVRPTNGDPVWLDIVVNVIVTVAVLGWGLYIGSRRELVWTLRQRAERAEAEQELRVSQARGTERARIAREMHDVLAHRISQISLHAGALGFRTDLDADELRGRATLIRDAGQRRAHRPARRARRAARHARPASRPAPRCRPGRICRRWSSRPARRECT